MTAAKRQPLEARVQGSMYRSWWPGTGRLKKKAQRRSARRERYYARQEIREELREKS